MCSFADKSHLTCLQIVKSCLYWKKEKKVVLARLKMLPKRTEIDICRRTTFIKCGFLRLSVSEKPITFWNVLLLSGDICLRTIKKRFVVYKIYEMLAVFLIVRALFAGGKVNHAGGRPRRRFLRSRLPEPRPVYVSAFRNLPAFCL